jgi:outer membrane usher protein FimD/PapC
MACAKGFARSPITWSETARWPARGPASTEPGAAANAWTATSQPVGRGYVYLNGSYGKNWNGTASRSVSLAYSNTIGKLNYNISFTQSRNLNSSWANAHAPRHDNTLMLTLSMPLGGPATPRTPSQH